MNLNQVTIQVADLQRSIDFYQLLGLRMIVHAPPRYARFECPFGESTFSLHTTDQIVKPEGCWIYFEVEALDAKVRELESKGMIFQDQPGDQPWLWRESRIIDPDGYTVILYFAGVNRKNPPWRIDNGEGNKG